MLAASAALVGGLGLLVVGGEALIRGALRLAHLLGLPPSVIAITVVAAGTSFPELAVSALAAWEGAPTLAVANVVGSNIVNVAVVVGLCAVIRPMQVVHSTLRIEYPMLLGVSGLCAVLVQDGAISRLDAGILLVLFCGVTSYLILIGKGQNHEAPVLDHDAAGASGASVSRHGLVRAMVLVAGGAALLGIGAHLVVQGATELARILGMSERFIGITIVAGGTSLPEVVASGLASYRGRSEIAIGNAIGSNLFNILAILGLSGLLSPLPVPDAVVRVDMWWMMGITALALPLLWTRMRLARWEGALLLASYGAYLTVLIQRPM